MRQSPTLLRNVLMSVSLLLGLSGLHQGNALSAQTTPQMDVVLNAEDANTYRITFDVVSDPTAADGLKLTSSDDGYAAFNNPPTDPLTPWALYSIHVPAPGAYRLWLRMRGKGDSKWNESVWVQFSHATQNGAPAYRIGTDSGLLVNLEDCSGCGMQGWGWQDNAWWLNQSSVVTLPQGEQQLKILMREDGVEIDQIVLSPARYMQRAPGPVKNDTTLLPRTEVILMATDATTIQKLSIVEQQYGPHKLSSADAGWSSTEHPAADPGAGGYADFVFNSPQPGPYHLWIRMQASANSKWNDSLWVQFSNATVNGAPAYRLGTPEGLLVNLEDCYGCGVQNFGWQDASWWLNQSPVVTLPGGPVTMRVLVREDGVEFNQIVLSPSRFMTSSPGQLKNDDNIVGHIWF